LLFSEGSVIPTVVRSLRLLLASLAFATQARAGSLAPGVTASPGPVCDTERAPRYLNVDFIIHNGTDSAIAISEVRASVLGPMGGPMEQRIVWQGALDLLGLGVGAKVPPHTDGIIYNPLHFSSSAPGRRVLYEFDVNDNTSRAVVTIVPELCRTKANLILPLTGRVAVLDGHDLLSHHRRFNYLASWARKEGMIDNVQRFALDLVVVDSAGRRFRGLGSRNEDFYGWGQPVRAPAAGVVVSAHDGQTDNDQIGSENRWHGKTWESSGGNYVVIRHNPREFSVIDHMRLNSLKVKTGDVVRTGQIVGQVGNSGSSLMPHVHYEMQDGAGVKDVHGVPAYFRGVRLISGEEVPDRGVVLDTGDIVIAN
jgi:hypothetical protein